MRPLYNKKNKGSQPRVCYQAIPMAADEDGFYGFAKNPGLAPKSAEEALKSRTLAHMQQLF